MVIVSSITSTKSLKISMSRNFKLKFKDRFRKGIFEDNLHHRRTVRSVEPDCPRDPDCPPGVSRTVRDRQTENQKSAHRGGLSAPLWRTVRACRAQWTRPAGDLNWMGSTPFLPTSPDRDTLSTFHSRKKRKGERNPSPRGRIWRIPGPSESIPGHSAIFSIMSSRYFIDSPVSLLGFLS